MGSNSVVTYIDIGLNSVNAYWQQLIEPAVADFSASPSARTLFDAATRVWHLHDWIWHEENPGVNSRGEDYREFQRSLVIACPQLGWLRDVADASKHRGLGRLPEVTGAHPRNVEAGGLLMFGVGGGGKLRFSLVLNDGSHQDFETVLNRAIEFFQGRLPGIVRA